MLISQRPTLSEEVVAENRSKFTIEPLEPGFGYTIGNSLRRTLLSSIPGAAVTSIRIEGVLHEFTTVPGVKEDVTDIILNLKGLVVSSTEDEPVTMYVKKQGPGVITAADIVPPTGVEVHNPDMHIATLNEKGHLEIELVVERGRGYVPAGMNAGTPSRPAATMMICSASATPWTRTKTSDPRSACGTEYCPDSKATIGVLTGTFLDRPNAIVCARSGTGCILSCS